LLVALRLWVIDNHNAFQLIFGLDALQQQSRNHFQVLRSNIPKGFGLDALQQQSRNHFQVLRSNIPKGLIATRKASIFQFLSFFRE